MCAAMSDLQHEEKIAWYLINYDSNKRYKINIGRLTIGSDLTNHVICQTRCPPHVSPEHCYIELFSDGTIFLTDMSTAGTFIQNIKIHNKMAKLYNHDELILAQDDQRTKFQLFRTNNSIHENEIVNVKDEKKCEDEQILPSTSIGTTNNTNNNEQPEPSSETAISLSSCNSAETVLDSSTNSILPATLNSISHNPSENRSITTSDPASGHHMEILSVRLTDAIRHVPGLQPPQSIRIVYHHYMDDFRGTEKFNSNPFDLLRNLIILQACLATITESMNIAFDAIEAEAEAAENGVPSDTENSNDCENEEVVEKEENDTNTDAEEQEDQEDDCKNSEETMSENVENDRNSPTSGEHGVGSQEEGIKNGVDDKKDDLNEKMSSQNGVA